MISFQLSTSNVYTCKVQWRKTLHFREGCEGHHWSQRNRAQTDSQRYKGIEPTARSMDRLKDHRTSLPKNDLTNLLDLEMKRSYGFSRPQCMFDGRPSRSPAHPMQAAVSGDTIVTNSLFKRLSHLSSSGGLGSFCLRTASKYSSKVAARRSNVFSLGEIELMGPPIFRCA